MMLFIVTNSAKKKEKKRIPMFNPDLTEVGSLRNFYKRHGAPRLTGGHRW